MTLLPNGFAHSLCVGTRDPPGFWTRGAIEGEGEGAGEVEAMARHRLRDCWASELPVLLLLLLRPPALTVE
ncbi:hypothetical protein MDA_GLEAN10014465 [Myotis davidii]|uniref:Uncharacterized protein n=1 Tax=Myotis davidii TaxID=225400 RepID=L5LCG5_MYODS|nr:hypothetical protein MDA_GLEAN10014465 [Myotis davidii]